MTALRIGLVGFGKIAQDQHVPAIESDPRFELAAVATLHPERTAYPTYRSVEAMLEADPEIRAVIMCQPPAARFEAAQAALSLGMHVLLEKPPGVTLSQVEQLDRLARARGVTLFASWHSRFGAAMRPAAALLRERRLRAVSIVWEEDVEEWHPGQGWIWQPGGFGVFDPAINALSILTELVGPVQVEAASLALPAWASAPIAAEMRMSSEGVPITAIFDWRVRGRPTWDIRIATEEGGLVIGNGGNTLSVDGVEHPLPAEAEYPLIYDHFHGLIMSGSSDVDLRPLQLVADAMLCGRHERVQAGPERSPTSMT